MSDDVRQEQQASRGFISRLRHPKYESDGRLVLFRCTECGLTSMSIGSLHAHIDAKHVGYTRLKTPIPFTKHSAGNFNRLMESTEVLRVEEQKTIGLEDVEGL